MSNGQKVFITDERRDILEGDDRGLTDESLYTARSRIRKRAETAFKELIEVAQSDEIDNNTVFRPELVRELLDSLYGNIKSIDDYDGNQQEHYDEFQYQHAIHHVLQSVQIRQDRVMHAHQDTGLIDPQPTDQPTKCDHCDHEWTYTGKFTQRTTCPNCMRKTTIGKEETE